MSEVRPLRSVLAGDKLPPSRCSQRRRAGMHTIKHLSPVPPITASIISSSDICGMPATPAQHTGPGHAALLLGPVTAAA